MVAVHIFPEHVRPGPDKVILEVRAVLGDSRGRDGRQPDGLQHVEQ